MRQDTTADRMWSIALIVLPVLAFVLGSIPGFLIMYDADPAQMEGYSLWNPPDGNIMSNVCPLLLVVFGYTLILSVCYYRSQALGTIKAIFVFSVVCLCLSAMAMLPDNTVESMPYVLIPCVWAVMSVASFIRMKKEIKRYDFD